MSFSIAIMDVKLTQVYSLAATKIQVVSLTHWHYIDRPDNYYSTVSMFSDEFERTDVNDSIGCSWNPTSNAERLGVISDYACSITTLFTFFASCLFCLELCRRRALFSIEFQEKDTLKFQTRCKYFLIRSTPASASESLKSWGILFKYPTSKTAFDSKEV